MKKLLQHTEYYSDNLFAENRCPLQPDLWPGQAGYKLFQPSEFDLQYFGEGTIRIETGHELIPTLAIKVRVTGRTIQLVHGGCRIRVEIEFLKDGEPSDYTGGWLWLGNNWNWRELYH